MALLSVVIISLSCNGMVRGEDDRSTSHLSELVTNGSYLVQSKQKIIGHRKEDLFLPASTLKILTSLAALDLLGPEFRFETHFYIDDEQNLYIKGYGDPFLTSEEIRIICSSLKNRGITQIRSIFLDDSSYKQQQTPGITSSNNPYDAPTGALAVNFNTLMVDKLPSGAVQSAELQTPSLAIMKRLARKLPTGTQRINIGTDGNNTLISLQLQYVGELFCALLHETGIIVEGGFDKRNVPHSLEPFLIHKSSKNLKEVMGECLHYSNNFIANQVFLYCGLQKNGSPATWDKARGSITNFIEKTLHLSKKQLSVQDGSGLSRQNRMSAEALVTILVHFKQYADLLNRHSGVLLKSGTMQDVYCYGGYFTENETLIPFVILLNQKRNTRDKILRRLHAMFASS
ncbi:MAG: D-alanyl-D-alanine carboxypeptidase/D-alanyl-D-alanine-endopeptidase (penicillin-binding protein 4) [Desulforhopalus sp.]